MNHLKICEANVLPLLEELKGKPHLWNRNPARLVSHGPHRETDDIWIRYKDETENRESGDYSNFADAHDPIWYPAYFELLSLRVLIFDLMRLMHGERLGGILLYRIPPGKQIYPHVDSGWVVDYYDRFNFCLQSNPQTTFFYEDDQMVARQGDVHCFVNNRLHWVKNDGNSDHVILTVCLRGFKCLSPGQR